MTYESRLTLNYVFGTLTDAVSTSQTTLSSADFSVLPPGLSTITYVPITLQDPSTKVCEIVWANSHAAGAATVSVVRAREATAARAWPAGTLWTVAPTLRDGVVPVATRSALPADPHVGLRAFLQDEQVLVEWVLGVGWVGTSAAGFRTAVTAGSDVATLTVSNIPSALKKLVVHWVARSSVAAVYENFFMRVNGATGFYSASESNQVGTTTYPAVDWGPTAGHVGLVTGASSSAANWAAGVITVPGWNSSRGAVSYIAVGYLSNSTADTVRWMSAGQYTGAWPYTSLTFLANSGLVKAGSEFVIYGYA